MKPIVSLGSLLLGCLAPAAASANGTAPMPLEVQLLRADLVAVGRLGAPTTCLVGGNRYPCAELTTALILKGARVLLTRRYLLLNMGIMEQAIATSDVPESALLFLTRVPMFESDGAHGETEYYRLLLGRRSVLPLNNENDPRSLSN